VAGLLSGALSLLDLLVAVLIVEVFKFVTTDRGSLSEQLNDALMPPVINQGLPLPVIVFVNTFGESQACQFMRFRSIVILEIFY